jgi:hypothetical protein
VHPGIHLGSAATHPAAAQAAQMLGKLVEPRAGAKTEKVEAGCIARDGIGMSRCHGKRQHQARGREHTDRRQHAATTLDRRHEEEYR